MSELNNFRIDPRSKSALIRVVRKMNIGKIKNYLKESFLELKKVKWLSRADTLNLTVEVIIFALIFAAIYGLFDAILVKILLMLK